MTELHPDFADLKVEPGESHITGRHELFDIVNVLTFGGAADRPTHVPAELGAMGPVRIWESTGAADFLPFWNTNLDGAQYLYIAYGSVRVEFKDTEGDQRYGHYVGRAGDLLRLPQEVAHRTYSGDGRRRITLELMPHNPFWDDLGKNPVTPDTSRKAGGFAFEIHDTEVEISWPGGGSLRTPRDSFMRGVRALCAYEMHLGHNEFDGGFIVHDLGERVRLKASGHEETLNGREVLAVFHGLRDALTEGG
ncbi:cupin domain-containing protein [Actinomadura decatromicini]|uniref:Cupin domain-containing protein n=1 Tax=Actinomadura decatromicini TaxID=2604572 RepID=A0A5D3FQB0_9ACTN|nr:cupin domain-containing protein [Actinomadura decatromicini]TYK51007.1 cupin domain-containing protein [Actinomadura decatromicini]